MPTIKSRWFIVAALSFAMACTTPADPSASQPDPPEFDVDSAAKRPPDSPDAAPGPASPPITGGVRLDSAAAEPGADGGAPDASNGATPPPAGTSGEGGPASVEDLPAGNPAEDKEYALKVEGNSFELWIPGGIPKLRCIVTGGSKRRELARLNNCAHMTMPDGRSDGVKEPTGAGIVMALKQLATMTGRPEIEHLHMLASGYSYTAGHRTRQVHQIPERFLAMFTGGIGGDRPSTEPTRNIPWISFDGEKDGPRDMGLHWQVQNYEVRATSALFGKAIRWGAGHLMGDSNNLMFAFYHQAIARRIPKGAFAEKGPIALVNVKEEQGWLIDVEGWNKPVPKIAPFATYDGDKKRAGWVIDGYTAHVWRAFTAPASPVRLTNVICPSCDNCTPLHRKVGDPFSVEVAVSKPASMVELYDGDKKLAALTAPPYKFPPLTLPAGVHALIAVATFPDGSKALSRPGALVVTKVTPPASATSCQ